MRFRVDRVARDALLQFSGQRIEQGEILDLAVEQFDAQRGRFRLGRVDVDHFAANAVAGASKFQFVAGVLHLGQAPDQFALVDPFAPDHVQHHPKVFVRIAEAVDRGYGRHDQGVASLQHGLGRRQPHLFDVLVDRGVLLDVGIRRRDIGFRLVVVVIADEVFDCIVREELLEFAVKLGGQGLVRCHHQGRFLHPFDQIGDGVGLARSGHSEQGLMGQAGLEAANQTLDRHRLVTGRLIGGNEAEAVGHGRNRVAWQYTVCRSKGRDVRAAGRSLGREPACRGQRRAGADMRIARVRRADFRALMRHCPTRPCGDRLTQAARVGRTLSAPQSEYRSCPAPSVLPLSPAVIFVLILRRVTEPGSA